MIYVRNLLLYKVNRHRDRQTDTETHTQMRTIIIRNPFHTYMNTLFIVHLALAYNAGECLCDSQ